MIEVINLTKEYGKLTALDKVSFEVKKGEILGFLGPNGAGKTTAMRIITGFLPATSGDVKLGGYDIRKEPLKAKKIIGYMPETVPFYEDLTVRESLNFFAELRGVQKSERAKRVKSVLQSCAIEDVEHRLIRTLSKGYRQRVGLAQALINNPQILILDEPTIGLDPMQIIEIRELIKSFAGKRTVILSSHILPEVSVICSRIAVIHKGELIALDTQEKLAEKALGGTTVFLSVKGPAKKISAGIEKINGVKSVSLSKPVESRTNDFVIIILGNTNKIRSEISSFIVKNKWDLLAMETRQNNLEEIFINLVNQHERSKR
jgi:ABC-2 type transport system ATP-binding protein